MLLAALVAASTVAAGCPTDLANDLRTYRPPVGATQLITVEAADTRTTQATLTTWRRSGRCWIRAAGPFHARVGRNGVAAVRREGDGTTPTGVYRIGATMYGTRPNPGVRFRYRRVRCGDRWDEDPTSPTYNTFQHVRCGTRPPFRVSSEGIWQNRRAYPYLAVVEFNMHPVVPGRGSGIFLHAETGGPTNGCISIARADLVRVLRWLHPRPRPRIVIGTTRQLRPA